MSHVGLYNTIFTYLARFTGSPCERLTRSLDKLQGQICARQDYLHYWVWRRPGSPTRQKLDSFRLAQKFRNEQGYSLDDRRENWFRSFEDIIKLENSIEAGNSVSFWIQCIQFDVVQAHTLGYVFQATDLPQLHALHDGVDAAKCYSHEIWRCMYTHRFVELATKLQQETSPVWKEIKQYLLRTSDIGNVRDVLFGSQIQDDEVEDTMNHLLNLYVDTNYGRYSTKGCTDVRFIKHLLDRGACLWFRGTGATSSSLVALIRWISILGYVPFDEFRPYICCPLYYASRYRRVTVDFNRLEVAPLGCLAARRIPRPLLQVLLLPPHLQSFIGAHRELQFSLGSSRCLRARISSLGR